MGFFRKTKTVKLRKDKDYVLCYFQKKIIEEEDCKMYEHNLECDKNDDFWGRTHRKGTLSGVSCGGESVINSCEYCLREQEKYDTVMIPDDVDFL